MTIGADGDTRYHPGMAKRASFLLAAIAIAACGVYGSEAEDTLPPRNDDAGTPTDGGATDGSVAPPETGFVVTVAPSHVVADPGDPIVSITVTLTRAKDFTDAVDVTLNALPPLAGVTSVSPLVVAGGSPGGPISFAVSDSATLGDYSIEVLGKSGSTTSSASFGLHLGSLLAATEKAASVPLPAWATKIDVAMWGAGGGGANYEVGNPAYGGSGGAGGFTSARIPVMGGMPLDVAPASGGSPSVGQSGGGGGGYSSISQGATLLAIAGGGGGGGTGISGGAHDGSPGHAPSNSKTSCQRGGNASATAGGAAGGSGGGVGVAGTALQGGGNAPINIGGAQGGQKGGGRSFDKAGGGGGGWFGGGSGGNCSGTLGGGGGGSAYAIAGSENVVSKAGSGSTPPETARADYSGSSAGNGGAGNMYPGGAGAKSGTSGRIVVRLAKQ